MTHGEDPWIAARRRTKAGPLERSKTRLRAVEIYEYFDALSSRAANADAED
jgi:hypothetical protein